MSTSPPHVVTVDQAESVAPLMPLGLLTNGLFRHREGLLRRRRLDPTAQALFEPGEQIVAAFDGVSRFPRWRWVGGWLVFLGVVTFVAGVSGHFSYEYFYPSLLRRHDIVLGPCEVAVGIVTRLVLRRLGSHRVMVAMTTTGVVECRTDRLNRPRVIGQRGPAGAPDFHESGERFRNVVIGPVDVYTDRASEKVLWRSMKRVQPRRLAHFAPLGGPWRDVDE